MSQAKSESASRRTAAQERAKRMTGAAISARVAAQRRRRALRRDAERVHKQRELLESEQAELARQQAVEGETFRQQARRLASWRDGLEGAEIRLLKRDDAIVREVLARKGELQAIYSAETSLAGDELLWFMLEHLGLRDALHALAPDRVCTDDAGKCRRRRFMVAPLVMNLLSILARHLGLRTGPQVQSELLADEQWMQLCGFTAFEVKVGVTSRSIDRRGMTRDEAGKFIEADDAGPKHARPDTVRGALSSQTVSQHEQDLPAAKLRDFFNACVRALAAKGAFAKKVRAVLDSTLLEVSPKFAGAGQATRQVKVKTKARRPATRRVKVRGFKLWVLMDAESRLPLAFALDGVEKPENAHVKDLVAQARANLGKTSTMTSIVLDRGFMDGDLLWWLNNEAKLTWVVPAKANMHVHAEAQARIDKVLARHARPDESPLDTACRLSQRLRPLGGVRFITRDDGPGRKKLVLASVPNLEKTDFYGPGGSSSSRVHSKTFVPTPLHGTMVLAWPDRIDTPTATAADVAPQQVTDAADDDDDDKHLLILSAAKLSGIQRYRLYDERSFIENGIFREGKQHFALGASYARNAAALHAAAVFSLIGLMMHRGLHVHEIQMREHQDRRARELGVLRYRRELAHRNRGKIVIAAANHYTIMPLSEFADIAGFPGVFVML